MLLENILIISLIKNSEQSIEQYHIIISHVFFEKDEVTQDATRLFETIFR